jgi:hypothetical protein
MKLALRTPPRNSETDGVLAQPPSTSSKHKTGAILFMVPP